MSERYYALVIWFSDYAYAVLLVECTIYATATASLGQYNSSVVPTKHVDVHKVKHKSIVLTIIIIIIIIIICALNNACAQ